MHLNMEDSEAIEEALPKYHDLLLSISESVSSLSDLVKGLKAQMNENFVNHKNGLPLLNIKNACMAHYLRDLLHVAGYQLSGHSIEDSGLVNRLIEQRVSLERVRPLEDKMKYKIEKLSKIAHGTMSGDNPLQEKPDIGNLDISDDEEDEEVDEDNSTPNQDRIYKAPRKQPVFPPSDVEAKGQKALQNAKKRAISSRVIGELKDQYGDEPEVESTNELRKVGKISEKLRRDLEHQENYEMANFTRVSLPGKKGHWERDSMRKNEFNTIANFGDTSVLNGAMDGADVLDAIKKQKRKRKEKMKSFSGKKRKRK